MLMPLHLVYIRRGLDPQRGYTSDALSPDHPVGYGVGVNGPQQQQQQALAAAAAAAAVAAQNQRSATTTATPTMQQRIKPLGVATPLVMASPVRR